MNGNNFIQIKKCYLKHCFCILFLSMVMSHGLAQSICGQLIDERKLPLPYANVVLLSLPDSAFVTGTVSDENGSFILKMNQDNLLLRVSSIGYATIYNKVEKPDLGTIQLLPDAQLLGEVVVKGDLPVIRMHGDALVTNVQNSVLSKAGSANDVLSKIPGITKGQNGFEVFGKGAPLIYINGRKMLDMSELEQLNADEIKNVEVIRNPGARYDATVKAVVRIQTLRKNGEGFGFNLRSSYYQSENNAWIEQIGFNYRHNNWDVFGMLYYNKQVNELGGINQQYANGTKRWDHNQNYSYRLQSQYISADIGLNYTFNENHVAGIKYKINKSFDNRGERSGDTYTKCNDVLYDNLKTFRKDTIEHSPGHDLNVYYNGSLGSVKLEFNGNYYQNALEQYQFNNENSQNSTSRTVHSSSIVKNRLFAGKLTLTFPFVRGEFVMGSEMTYTHRNDDYLNLENYVPTSYSRIKEMNAAGFVEYNHKMFGGDLSFGLRYEHVKFDYYENEKHVEGQSRRFDNLFPNIAYGTRFGPVYTRISYTAKTLRPTYTQLSNNVSYIDRYTLQRGDPSIQPILIHDVTLTGTWKFMQFIMSYKRAKNQILYWADFQKEDGSLIMIHYRNMEKALPTLSAFLSASPKIGCWSSILSIGVQKQWLTIVSGGESLKMNKPIFVGSFNNTFELPAGFMIGLDAHIQGKGDVQNVYSSHIISNVDIMFRKDFLQEALSVELKGVDLFRQNRIYHLFRCGNYALNQENVYDSRKVVLTLRYKFNTTKSKYKGTGAGQEQRSRM